MERQSKKSIDKFDRIFNKIVISVILVIIVLLFLVFFTIDVKAEITYVYDTGIEAPYQGKSTHNYEDFYTYYAQSFVAPDQWLIDLSIPLYENENNVSKNNPSFTIELWDDVDNVLAQSVIFDPPTNRIDDPVYYGFETNGIELIPGDTYWAVYNPLPDDAEEAWCGFYIGTRNFSRGYYNKQYFAPGDTIVTSNILYAYYMTFSSVAIPEPITIVMLGLGGLFLRKRK